MKARDSRPKPRITEKTDRHGVTTRTMIRGNERWTSIAKPTSTVAIVTADIITEARDNTRLAKPLSDDSLKGMTAVQWAMVQSVARPNPLPEPQPVVADETFRITETAHETKRRAKGMAKYAKRLAAIETEMLDAMYHQLPCDNHIADTRTLTLKWAIAAELKTRH